MKKVKFTLCILLIILSFSLCSCFSFHLSDHKYYCYIEKVESIRIVRLDEYVEEESRYEYTVLAEIEDCPAFVERFNSIENVAHGGKPKKLSINDTVILINYTNGKIDYIHHIAQEFFRSGELRVGYYSFDEVQYNNLINDYLPDEYKVKT
ncbi:MAG: hypothetical protein IJX51_06810 [Clostridia bacterium]|nr:hypothetical protein [Clostridia bacterium]